MFAFMKEIACVLRQLEKCVAIETHHRFVKCYPKTINEQDSTTLLGTQISYLKFELRFVEATDINGQPLSFLGKKSSTVSHIHKMNPSLVISNEYYPCLDSLL